MWIGFEPHHRIGDADLVEKLDNAILQGFPAQTLMHRKALTKLFFYCVQRVQRGHRLLKNKADIIAANALETRLRRANHLFASVKHRAARNGTFRQKIDSGQSGHRFA